MSTVAFTAHQRPWYLRETLEVWRGVREVRDWRVEFNLDPSDQQDAQLAIMREFADWHGDAHVRVNADRKGVLGNPWYALSRAFKTADYVVLAEEDVHVSDDVLEYFAYARTRREVLAACAWSDTVGGSENGTELRRWFNPWCWGTSWDRWDVISRTWDFDYSTGGWDTNLGLYVVNDANADVLFPQQSRSCHVGKWAGAHQDPSKHGATEMPESFRPHREPQDWYVRA